MDSYTTTGAVRSSDANHMDFTSIPLVGLLGVARTASEGAEKYGRLNYMLGMPVHEMLNHSIRHVVMFLLGDRSEPHLEHAAWGLMAAIQSATLDPELSLPHLLGPGATVTPSIREHLKANAARLKEFRGQRSDNGHGEWCIFDLPEVNTLLNQRCAVQKTFDFMQAAKREERQDG